MGGGGSGMSGMMNELTNLRIAVFVACASALLCSSVRGGNAFSISPSDVPNDGRIFVDHSEEGRSGHGGQAIAEAKNGDIIAFYSNVSGTLHGGHSASGWSEYRISEDGGHSWSEPYILEYSMDVWNGDEYNSVLVDEVVTAPNGTIVAFARRYVNDFWRSVDTVYLRSYDHGRTWTEALEVDPAKSGTELSREEASLVYGNTIFVLFNDRFSNFGMHRLYVSVDSGETFKKRSILPFDWDQWYGTMGVMPDGRLIAYSYNSDDDGRVLQYTISEDLGRSWSGVETTEFEKRIRNPQLSDRIGRYYLMHGRSGQSGDDPRHFVLYRSTDAVNWDEGVFLNRGSADSVDSYSTNAVVGRFKDSTPTRLLIQASIGYDDEGRRVNLHHWEVGDVAGAFPESFSEWKSWRFSEDEIQDPEVSGAGADPNGDGMQNLMKYALGQEPWASSAMNFPVMRSVSDGQNRYIELEFWREAAIVDVDVIVEGSRDLREWTGFPVLIDSTLIFPLVREVWRDTLPLNTSQSQFYRLRAIPK